MIVLTIIYLVSPIDLVPDIVFGIFGLIDDGALLGLFVLALISILRGYENSKKPTNTAQTRTTGSAN